ncbi:MAG: hypothetical protein ACYC18_12400 [Gammaproteobacteria bacterium]
MVDMVAGFAENFTEYEFDLLAVGKEMLPILVGQRGKQAIRMECGCSGGH